MIAVDISGVNAQAHAQQLRWVLSRCRDCDEGKNAQSLQQIDEVLGHAERLAGNAGAADDSEAAPPTRRRAGARWLRLEAAWQSLHVAEESLLTIAPEPMVRARGSEILSQGAAWFGADDARVRQVMTLVGQRPDSTGTSSHERLSMSERYTLLALLRAVHEASDRSHARIRSFRGILLTAFVLLVLAVGALILVGALAPTALPLCSSGPPETTRPAVCPTGGAAASGGDVMLVALIGGIAAGISAVAAISTLAPLADEYQTPILQGLLKIPIGAFTAILGVLAIEGGLDAGAGVPTSQGGILFLAFVFGYSQQIVTRMVDARGSQIRAGLTGQRGGVNPRRPDFAES